MRTLSDQSLASPICEPFDLDGSKRALDDSSTEVDPFDGAEHARSLCEAELEPPALLQTLRKRIPPTDPSSGLRKKCRRNEPAL
mmetsp:Transcript_8429/g.29785  ORF Transcript_8429/g.29785 Transcript_8429/m.29785 type:complete len:84 (+) Transcript_8429:67-318(+)